MAKKVIYLSTELMEHMCHRLAVTFFAHYQEPIPPFDDHNPELLDSSINLPKATFGRIELYPNISTKAAVLFYSIIKNHPFKNGNKRLGTAALLVFLYLNGYWIIDSKKSIYKQAVKAAASNSLDREKVLKNLEVWLRNHLIKVKKLRKRDIPLWLIDRTLHVLSGWIPRFWRRNKTKAKNFKS